MAEGLAIPFHNRNVELLQELLARLNDLKQTPELVYEKG